jgi:hypothetical protein
MDRSLRARHFLEGYAAAYLRRDAEAVAAMFSFPSFVVSDSGASLTLVQNESPGAWRGQIEALFRMYAAIGVARVELLSLDARALPHRLVLADVHWQLRDAAGAPLYDFDTLYVLGELDGSLRIASAVSPNELPRYRACAARLQR